MRTSYVTSVSASVLTLALMACTTTDITAVGPSALAKSSAASVGVERPWKGNCDVIATFTSATEITITGTCQYAHLGRTKVLTYQTIEPGESGIAFTNVSTYTAANGDELHTTDVGVATPNSTGLQLDATQTAVGGTGRFTNAHGTATLVGTVNAASAVGAYSVDGRLTY